MANIFFHVDLDAFFASVEQLDHSDYRNKPVVVGSLSSRGVVASCSYEARAYGVHAAMPIGRARQLCPHALFIQARIQRYSEMSKRVFFILQSFSPNVQQVSIDEAFLDMTGMQRLFGTSHDAAMLLKKTVHAQTGLIISVGIGPSRFIAKMASDFGKPDGLYEVEKGSEIAFIDKVGLKRIWGIGESTFNALQRHAISTVEQLRRYPEEQLCLMFGNAAGSYLYQVSRGIDPLIFGVEAKSRSISTEMTFPVDITESSILKQNLLRMSHEVMFRALDEQVTGTTVTIKIRYSDFVTTTAQETSRKPIYSAEEIYHIATKLLQNRWKAGEKVRLLGVGLGNLQAESAAYQEELFEDPYQRKRKLEKTVLALRAKGNKLEKAATLTKDIPDKHT